VRPLLRLAALPIALAGSLWGQSDGGMDATLGGLTGFAVFIDLQLEEGTNLHSIDENELRTKLELALRREAIRVLSQDEYRKDPAAPGLRLRYVAMGITNKAGEATGFAASGSLEVLQLVTLQRSNAISGRSTVTPTWRHGGIFVGSTDSFRSSILTDADKRIASFLNAWFTANPRHRNR
jgi:hypothetical protein